MAEPTSRAGHPAERGPTPDAVEIPLDVLDRIVDDLFAVGLVLHAGAGKDDEERRNSTEAILDGLDRIVARIRECALSSVLAGTH